MRTLMVGMVLAVALAGCQAKLPNMQPGTTTPSGQVQAPPTTLAGLRFQPVSAETAAKLSQQGGMGTATEGARSAAAPTAPGAAPAPAGMVAGDAAVGAKMAASPYYFGSYFSGPYGQMKLNSVTEAKAAGSTGTWKEMQASVIAPVVTEWAADARLIQTNGALGEDGRPIQGTENYPGENAWRASYASTSRGEVLEFTISANETNVLRLQWVPITIDAANLSVDASEAVAKLTQAVGDSAFKSVEEILGKDYFFGDGMDVGVGIAVPPIARVAPTIAVDPATSGPTTTPSSGGGTTGSAGIAVGEPAPGSMPTPPEYTPPKEEPQYSLLKGGRWYVNLQTIGDKVVWDLNYNPGPNAPTYSYNPGETYVDNYAYGMINAKTGEVIRLRRPMKVTLPAGPIAKPEPRPMPAEDKAAQ